MNRTTALMSQWKIQRASGKNLFNLYGDINQKSIEDGKTQQNSAVNGKLYSIGNVAGSRAYGVRLSFDNKTSITVSGEIEGLGSAEAGRVCCYGNDNYASDNLGVGKFSVIFNVSDSCVIGFSGVNRNLTARLEQPVVFKNIQIELGNTATEYEPYSGGNPTALQINNCKGGYFSTNEEFGLKVIGRTAQDGTPTVEAPIPIQCVKTGSKVICGKCEITVPCDLYEGDIWYPMSGKVERQSTVIVLTGDEQFRRYSDGAISYPELGSGAKKDERNKSKCTIATYQFGISLSGFYLNDGYLVFGAEFYPTNTEQDWISMLQSHYNQGNPVTVVFKRETPQIADVDPQPIFAPQGIVNITQEPQQLSADLSAAMLVRR